MTMYKCEKCEKIYDDYETYDDLVANGWLCLKDDCDGELWEHVWLSDTYTSTTEFSQSYYNKETALESIIQYFDKVADGHLKIFVQIKTTDVVEYNKRLVKVE